MVVMSITMSIIIINIIIILIISFNSIYINSIIIIMLKTEVVQPLLFLFSL